MTKQAKVKWGQIYNCLNNDTYLKHMGFYTY